MSKLAFNARFLKKLAEAGSAVKDAMRFEVAERAVSVVNPERAGMTVKRLLFMVLCGWGITSGKTQQLPSVVGIFLIAKIHLATCPGAREPH